MLTQAERSSVAQAQKARFSITKSLNTDFGVFSAFDLMGIDPMDASPVQWDNAYIIREQILHGLEGATALAVPPELCQITSTYAPTYPDLRIDSSDVFLPQGWAYFTDPIIEPNTPDDIPIRALLWWTYPLADLSIFDPGDVSRDRYGLTLVGFSDVSALPGALEKDLSHLPRVVPMVSVMWELDTPDGGEFWPDSVKITKEGVFDVVQTRSPYIKTLQTLWATIRQRMTEPSEDIRVMEKQFKHYRKKTGRPVNRSVRVLRLSEPRRRRYEPTGTGNPLTDRVWTRGHWRMQPFPSRGYLRPKLILPFLRGPWDAPIVKGQERMLLPPRPLDDTE